MTRILRRQLTDGEKKVVMEQHGRRCFAEDHEIPEDEVLEFDHIHAFASDGMTEVNNIAPMCRYHNSKKGKLHLYDFQIKLQMDKFFDKGHRQTLHDLLEYLKDQSYISDYALPVSVRENGDNVRLESAKVSQEFRTYSCEVTGWKYFYATIPIDLVDSDDDRDQMIGLQPRYLLRDKVFDLFLHFQRHPVLQPSLGRVVGGRIRLFDGQHKAAAILWNGRRDIECKIYLDPEIALLNQTNISAHDKFSQTRFFSSIMIGKLGTQFKGDFKTYRDREDGQIKSESGFMDYLRAERGFSSSDATKRFTSFLYDSVIGDNNNKLSRLVSVTNRANAQRPITSNALINSLFASFLYRRPVDHDMTTDAYKRDVEIQNVVKLLNMVYDTALSQWDPTAANGDPVKLKLARIIRSRFMKAWAELMKDAVCPIIGIRDTDEWAYPFYRDLTKQNFDDVQTIVDRLVNWKMWSAPPGSEIDTTRSDTDRAAKIWVRNKGLSVEYLLGVPD